MFLHYVLQTKQGDSLCYFFVARGVHAAPTTTDIIICLGGLLCRPLILVFRPLIVWIWILYIGFLAEPLMFLQRKKCLPGCFLAS